MPNAKVDGPTTQLHVPTDFALSRSLATREIERSPTVSKAQLLFWLLLLGMPGLSMASPGIDSCAALATFHGEAVRIETATVRAASPYHQDGPRGPTDIALLVAHCQVTGVADQRIGVGGKSYGIRFEMRLPDAWNGRFLFQGGGGTNGVVKPALGLIKGPAALNAGFAVVSQDAGHEGTDSSFGEDQQARIDMLYRSYERVTVIAKALIAVYYGMPPEHSYFMGCSEGGREALLVSQRMPLAYDGVVAGDPGLLLGVRFQAEVDRVQLKPLAEKGADGKYNFSGAFSVANLRLVADAITQDCDANDGLSDGLVDAWSMCHPDLRRLECGRNGPPQCLTRKQLIAIRRIFNGVAPYTLGFFYDTGIGEPAWHEKLTGGGRLGGGGVSSIQGLFSTPYDPHYDDVEIDLARDAPRFAEVGSLNRSDGVLYSSFKQHGGKLLMYTGLSDFAFSAKDLIAYFERLAAANGGLQSTQNFARLFLVPGMTHCAGGRSLDDFDPLAAIVHWVEDQTPPSRILASGKSFPGRTRPLCAYPEETRYNGHGSGEDAANFACEMPSAKGGRVTER